MNTAMICIALIGLSGFQGARVFVGIHYETCPSAIFGQVSPNRRIHVVRSW